MLPNSEMVWCELVKFLLTFDDKEQIPSSYFQALRGCMLDWAANVYSGERDILMRKIEDQKVKIGAGIGANSSYIDKFVYY